MCGEQESYSFHFVRLYFLEGFTCSSRRVNKSKPLAYRSPESYSSAEEDGAEAVWPQPVVLDGVFKSQPWANQAVEERFPFERKRGFATWFHLSWKCQRLLSTLQPVRTRPGCWDAAARHPEKEPGTAPGLLVCL